MIEIALILSLVLAFIVGSNDVMGSLGVSYGSKVVSMRKALALIIVFGLLGIFLFGHLIMKTIGSGIVPVMNPLPVVVSAILISVVILYFRIPASMTQVVVGSLVGYAFASSLPIYWSNFSVIILSLMVSPVMGIVLAGTFYVLYIKYVLNREMSMERRYFLKKLFVYYQIITGCIMAGAIGAMDVGIVMGFNIGFENILLLEIIGGIGISAGVLVWGRKILRHVSRGMVSLTPEKGFFAQLAGLITVMCFLLSSIPVSPTTILVASIMGVGLVSGKINRHIMFDILILWMLVVPMSILLGFAVSFAF